MLIRTDPTKQKRNEKKRINFLFFSYHLSQIHAGITLIQLYDNRTSILMCTCDTRHTTLCADLVIENHTLLIACNRSHRFSLLPCLSPSPYVMSMMPPFTPDSSTVSHHQSSSTIEHSNSSFSQFSNIPLPPPPPSAPSCTAITGRCLHRRHTCMHARTTPHPLCQTIQPGRSPEKYGACGKQLFVESRCGVNPFQHVNSLSRSMLSITQAQN